MTADPHHLEPYMRELRGAGGPFAGCTKKEHQIAHRMPVQVPSARRVEDA